MRSTWGGSDTPDDDLLSVLQGRSISYRITLGPLAGRKVFALQTLPSTCIDESHTEKVDKVAVLILHACIAPKTHERENLAVLRNTKPRISGVSCI